MCVEFRPQLEMCREDTVAVSFGGGDRRMGMRELDGKGVRLHGVTAAPRVGQPVIVCRVLSECCQDGY